MRGPFVKSESGGWSGGRSSLPSGNSFGGFSRVEYFQRSVKEASVCQTERRLFRRRSRPRAGVDVLGGPLFNRPTCLLKQISDRSGTRVRGPVVSYVRARAVSSNLAECFCPRWNSNFERLGASLAAPSASLEIVEREMKRYRAPDDHANAETKRY